MPYWQCYYHIVWATKYHAPLITPQIEALIFPLMQDKSTALASRLFAVNGTANHVHLAVSIPPKLAVADWVKHVKGTASREINLNFPDLPHRFRWQGDYSVLTFGARHLDFVVKYVRQQKEHHADNQVIAYLEQIGNANEPL